VAISRRELELLYRDLEVPLYNFALRWVFNPAQAEELVHDAFVRLWNRRDEVEFPTIKSLLFKTTQNLCLNEIRKRKVREAFAILKSFVEWDDDTPTTEENLIEDQELQRLRLALEKLPHDLREVLLLFEYSGMSYAEIASTLEIAEGTVASRKNRALQMIRELMSEIKEPKNER
jgi:RNA polymerase sigma-70 factor (family 1)